MTPVPCRPDDPTVACPAPPATSPSPAVARDHVPAPGPGRCPVHAPDGPSAHLRPSADGAGAPRRWADLPAPRGWPVLGQLPGFDPLRAHLHFEDWLQRHGSPCRFSMGPGYQGMLTDDVELAQRLSRERPHDFTRGGRVRPVTAEMGFEGLFSVEGAAWAPQRRLIMQALNATHFRGWTADLLRTTDRLAARWDRAVAAGGRTELLDDLRRYTVDVTSTLAFGQDTDTLSGGEDVIQRQLAVIFPAMMKRVMTPFSWWHWVRLPEDRRVDRALSAVHAHARACVERARRALPGADPAAPRHALEALLQQQSSLGLRDEDVIANVITLLLAGEDTTAHALAWTAFHLAQAPALQATWAARARAALGPEGRCTQAGQLQALEGLEHLAWEAMRLHPVVPFNVFEPVRDTEVGGVAVAAGTKICFVNRPALTDPSRFPDPLAYRPERWVDPAGHDPRAFLQFGAGPRVCPGRHLATLEIRLVLGTLLARHAWTLDTPADRVREVNAFTMHPDRLPVRLVPRP